MLAIMSDSIDPQNIVEGRRVLYFAQFLAIGDRSAYTLAPVLMSSGWFEF